MCEIRQEHSIFQVLSFTPFFMLPGGHVFIHMLEQFLYKSLTFLLCQIILKSDQQCQRQCFKNKWCLKKLLMTLFDQQRTLIDYNSSPWELCALRWAKIKQDNMKKGDNSNIRHVSTCIMFLVLFYFPITRYESCKFEVNVPNRYKVTII